MIHFFLLLTPSFFNSAAASWLASQEGEKVMQLYRLLLFRHFAIFFLVFVSLFEIMPEFGKKNCVGCSCHSNHVHTFSFVFRDRKTSKWRVPMKRQNIYHGIEVLGTQIFITALYCNYGYLEFDNINRLRELGNSWFFFFFRELHRDSRNIVWVKIPG